MLNEHQLLRYNRNILLDGVGREGQEKLLNSRVLVIGAGGLGSPVAFYLAAAGVGTLGLVDGDTVEYSNLQRQIIHGTTDLGRAKVESAREKLTGLNPEVNITIYRENLSGDNYLSVIEGYDVVVDGTDNFPVRFLINKACLRYGIPYVYGGVLGFTGQVMTILPGSSPCLCCVFPVPPRSEAPTCGERGVLGTVPGVIGCIQATEVIKYLLGMGELLTGRLLTYDALSMRFFDLEVHKNEECRECGSGGNRGTYDTDN